MLFTWERNVGFFFNLLYLFRIKEVLGTCVFDRGTVIYDYVVVVGGYAFRSNAVVLENIVDIM